MSHDFLCDAPDQYVFKTSQSMCRCNDQIDIVSFAKAQISMSRRAIRKRRLKFHASEFYRPHELRMWRSAFLRAAFCKARNVVEGGAFARIDVSEICRVQQNDPGPKFIREPNRVLETFP